MKPAFDDFVLPSKKYADVIIPRGGDNHVAVDLIVEHIRTKLGQHDLCKIYPNVHVVQSTFQVKLVILMNLKHCYFADFRIPFAFYNQFYRSEECILLFVTGTSLHLTLFFIQIG